MMTKEEPDQGSSENSVKGSAIMSLRGLINLRIVMSVFIILLVGGSLAIWQARESVRDEVDSSFNLALQMIDFGLGSLAYTDDAETAWLRQINRLRETRHLRITVIDKQGKTSNLSSNDGHAANHLPPGWFISAVMTETLEKVYEIHMSDDTKHQIVISADPMDEIIEAWTESKAYFWSIVMMMGVIFLAINFVFHSMLKAVKTILAALKQVESGDYDHRLPRFQISEFDSIAAEVNNLSGALKQARENNQALARHTMQIQENERQHMSRELHDEMGQSLTAVKAMAVAVKQPSAKIDDIADSIIEICNHLSGVVRSMMRTLHPLSLTDLGLTATLTDLVTEWKRRHPALEIELETDETLDQLDDEVAIHVYRIIQESLTNVVRHAQANHVAVMVKQHSVKDESEVVIRVEDDGIGGATEGQGFGILAMRERVESMRGKFLFESAPGQGVRVRVWMPFIEKTV
jgi:two-component system sensor histidine kinase UhpB